MVETHENPIEGFLEEISEAGLSYTESAKEAEETGPSGEQKAAIKDLIQNADRRIIKRAQFEAFEFELEAPGLLTVINGSHEDPENHSYLVNVEKEVPCACECPAFEYGDRPCKHMIAVAIHEPVLEAAQSRQKPTPMPDGGKDIETCQNGQEGCCGPTGDDLPCFECYQDSH